jgi:predicted nucleic acid-binding protein
MAKVVIDAKVMIPGAFGGKSLEAVGRALKEYDVFVSESILEELEGVLKRLSKKLPPEQIHYLQERVGQFLKVAHRITVSTHPSLSRDAKDDHYLSLCKETQLNFLIPAFLQDVLQFIYF